MQHLGDISCILADEAGEGNELLEMKSYGSLG
ncbi:hypothetical protein HALLA_00605 (plasmid) [Halostagnicola larsenii XH-48]|uniref:Uncharacterized protein n=1 Tax=Halostagnicola larsenii XH-48 TaxID=797299 RepID=W0JTD1_9EURY|nr:hypothetical protein HALLA_00605 [Halostagnicola larsenii XH-48]